MTQAQKAATTRTAYNACHPNIPLAVGDNRYVDLSPVRGGSNFVTLIAQVIEWTQDEPPPPYYQQLVTGHRGCGKSTEFYRLKAELEEKRFFTVYFDVANALDLNNVDYLDVLLSITKALLTELNNRSIPVKKQFLQELYDWFDEKTSITEQKKDMKSDLTTKAGAGCEFPFVAKFFATLTSQLRIGSSQRDEIRKVLRRELSEFVRRMNSLIAEARKLIQEKEYKDLVIIVDGLEKMAFDIQDGKSTHEILFVQNAERLTAPECHIIYTVPISLAYDTNLSNAFGLDYITVIPMVNIKEAQGRSMLKDLVAARIEIDSVFDSPALVEDLVAMSGGAVRDLMRLIRIACLGSQKVGQADVEKAISILSMEYDRFIRHDDIKALRNVNKTRLATGDPMYSRLLHLRVLHEYQNKKRWVDLHPIMRRIAWIAESLEQNGDA
ncbi:MAG: hypothetical protein GY862_15175 [Gammaproteobacteria bacterium]|nr:hypothetical protein [Gammaproteobacteria bacterium]